MKPNQNNKLKEISQNYSFWQHIIKLFIEEPRNEPDGKPMQWWGVKDQKKGEIVYIYKNESAARNQANRNEYFMAMPVIVMEQTPDNQKILNQ